LRLTHLRRRLNDAAHMTWKRLFRIENGNGNVRITPSVFEGRVSMVCQRMRSTRRDIGLGFSDG
jgi:hypothetical protein